MHVRAALGNGLTPEEIREVLLHTAVGVARGPAAARPAGISRVSSTIDYGGREQAGSGCQATRGADPAAYTCAIPNEERHVQEMVIYGVSFDMVGKQPIVLLKTVESNKFLPIWIGHPEAAAILMKLQGASTPRPMTHDLLSDMLGELEVECTRVAVTELRENTFYASISLRAN